jgi:hypothetical protein
MKGLKKKRTKDMQTGQAEEQRQNEKLTVIMFYNVLKCFAKCSVARSPPPPKSTSGSTQHQQTLRQEQGR